MAQKQQNSSSSGGVQKLSQPPSHPRSIKKPSRSVGMLKRPSAKLGGSRKSSEVNDVTHGMQRTQLIGKKRAGNPCGGDRSNEPPKKTWTYAAGESVFVSGQKELDQSEEQEI